MSDNIKETVAKNLLYYRKKNKITQKELAEKLGVKHNAISSWENGVNSIDIDTLFQICKIFGISVNDMYAGLIDDEALSLLIWIYCEDASYQDAADRLGISLQACKKRIQRAKLALKRAIEKNNLL